MALTDKLTAIGDAIRGKTGSTDLLTLDQMITEITNIQGSGNNIDFNVKAIKIAPSSETPLTNIFLKPDSNKNNIWVVPIRMSTRWDTDMMWQGYPGLVNSHFFCYSLIQYHLVLLLGIILVLLILVISQIMSICLTKTHLEMQYCHLIITPVTQQLIPMHLELLFNHNEG